jgi:ligand-binding SRPBCC domain-containing protein
MRYQHVFRVEAPLSAVAAFHSRSSSMPAITPPPIVVRVHQAPAVLQDGDEMDFTLWLGPLPVRWRARIEDVTPASFVDRQLDGPMGHWVHQHSFVPVDANTTDVVDEVDLGLRPHLFWGPVGLGMVLGLPVLFAYRGWKTRRLLMQDHQFTAPAGAQPSAADAIEEVERRLGWPPLTIMGLAGFAIVLAGLVAVALWQRSRTSATPGTAAGA